MKANVNVPTFVLVMHLLKMKKPLTWFEIICLNWRVSFVFD